MLFKLACARRRAGRPPDLVWAAVHKLTSNSGGFISSSAASHNTVPGWAAQQGRCRLPPRGSAGTGCRARRPSSAAVSHPAGDAAPPTTRHGDHSLGVSSTSIATPSPVFGVPWFRCTRTLSAVHFSQVSRAELATGRLSQGPRFVSHYDKLFRLLISHAPGSRQQ